MDINLDDVRTFIRLSQEGSFTDTATSLGKSQSSVSIQIARIERQFGLTLIDRSTRPAQLTEAGKLFLQFGTQLINQTVNLERTFRELASGISGEVRIGASTSVGTYILPSIACPIIEKFPKINIIILSLPQASVLEAVRTLDADFAFILADKAPQDLKTTTLKKEPLWFVSSPDNPVLKKSPLTMKNLESIPFILGLKGNQYTGMIERILEERGLPRVPVVMRIGNYEGIKRAICTGIGVGILPRFTVQTEIRDRRLARVLVPGVNLNANIMLVERLHHLERPTVVAVKASLSAAIRSLKAHA
jgi:DNA-binding transcriptional LysR family regulator